MITLYDLMHNATVQGDVRIRVYMDGHYDEIAMMLYRNVDDLNGENIPTEWEDLEARYLFVGGDGILNIELYMEEE